MPELTIQCALRCASTAAEEEGPITMGVLATSGTLRSRVYHRAAETVTARSGGREVRFARVRHRFV